MTGLGKYQKGLDLEAEGLSGKQIAAKLGYKDAASWYNTKQYYAKKQAAFNARAAGEPAEHPAPLPKEKAPVEAAVQKSVVEKTKNPAPAKKPAGLQFVIELSAIGTNHIFDVANGVIFATDNGPHETQALRIRLEHWETLKAEVDQVIARYKEVSK